MDNALLDKLVPLAGLRPEVRNNVLSQSLIREIPAGNYIFRVGDVATHTFYLLEGEIAFEDASGKLLTSIKSGEPAALYQLAHQSPRRASARAATVVEILEIDASLLDIVLTWDQTGSMEVQELTASTEINSADWMTRMLQMRCFQLVPPANLQTIFMRMQEVQAVAGQVIVRQGDQGDSFYVVAGGRCIVQREAASAKSVRLAELEPGACFGEAALLSGQPRDATVTMLTEGKLMRLARADFMSLMRDSVVRKIAHSDAQRRVSAGYAKWLDVRLPMEARQHALEGSVNVPLYLLRMKLGELDKKSTYITCCDTGRRSEVAAFVLTQAGFDVFALDRGLPN